MYFRILRAQVGEIMSCIITVALVSVWITVTSGITLGPSSSTGVPNTFNNSSPNIVTTLNNLWQGGTSCEVIFNTNPSNPTGNDIAICNNVNVHVYVQIDMLVHF